MISDSRRSGKHFGVACLALAATLLAAPGAVIDGRSQEVQDVAVKAAFFYNFIKFTEWPAMPAAAPIVACLVGDDRIAAAFAETVRVERSRGRDINGHAVDVSRPRDSAAWRTCHLLFVAEAEAQRSATALAGLRSLPVLTVGDGKGFALRGGIIELYPEDGRMHFAINVTAVERSGLILGYRLLGLAKIVQDRGVP